MPFYFVSFFLHVLKKFVILTLVDITNTLLPNHVIFCLFLSCVCFIITSLNYLQTTNSKRMNSSNHLPCEFFISPPSWLILCIRKLRTSYIAKSNKHSNNTNNNFKARLRSATWVNKSTTCFIWDRLIMKRVHIIDSFLKLIILRL